MKTAAKSSILLRLKPWQTIVVFSVLLMALTGFGTFFDILTGVGLFFLYVIGYFSALVVVLPILLIRRFGVGTAIYFICYVLFGLPVEYVMEWALNPALIGPWAAVGWSACGLATGCRQIWPIAGCRRLERAAPRDWTALIMALASFVFSAIALTTLYQPTVVTPPATFLSVAYWALPWLLLNSGFGGFTAHVIARDLRDEREYRRA